MIKRKAPSESHRTLGFHLNGDGTSTGHKRVMMDKIRLYSDAVDSSKLWKSESSLAYNSFYMKSIGYGTPETSLSYQECNNMQKPVVNSILPKMGFNRKAARAVVFGTSQHGGLGLDHLATVQLYGQLQYLIRSIRCNDTTGQLARMMLEFAKLECGCMGTVFEQDYERYHRTIIDKNWITEIWYHLQLYDSKIQTNGLWTPKPGREGDTSIMERTTAPGIFTIRELQEINRCRLYLQVFFLSELTDHIGRNIEDWAKQGHKQNRNSKWEWSVQQRPTSWKSSKQAVDEVLSCDGALT
jgi:hypothetical protein